MKNAVIAVVVIAILGGGAFALSHRKSDTNAKTANTTANNNKDATTQTASPDNSTTATGSSKPAAAATITYSDNGFSPSKVTVKAGSTVAVKNTSTHALQLDSNPHPAHTDDQDLNVGAVPNGESTTFTVTQKGTFGYHNHLNPSDTATIVVE